MNADSPFHLPHFSHTTNTNANRNHDCPNQPTASRPRGLLGQINLETSVDRPEYWVDMERFLQFSFSIAEDMADLVACYQSDSHVTPVSMHPGFRGTIGKMAVPK